MQKKMPWLFVTLLVSTGFCFAQTESKDPGQNPCLPRVVARLNLVDKTSLIPAATLYTPPQDGIFRITVVSACTKASQGGGGWIFYVSWTSDIGLINPVEVASVPASPYIGTQFPLTFTALQGTPITLSMSASKFTKGSHYNAYIIVEQLE